MRQNNSFSSVPASGRCKKLPAAGCDIKRIKPSPAETAFVGRSAGVGWLSINAPVGADVNQRTGSAALPTAHCDNVAFGVETHALDTAMVTR